MIVLVTEAEYRRAPEVFESAPVRCIATTGDEDALAAAVAHHGARYVIVGSVKYEGRLYETLPRGGVIARFGVGHDGIDKQKATTAGLFCTNTPSVLDESVAEHAILLMLAGDYRRWMRRCAGSTGRSDRQASSFVARRSRSSAADGSVKPPRGSRRKDSACGRSRAAERR